MARGRYPWDAKMAPTHKNRETWHESSRMEGEAQPPQQKKERSAEIQHTFVNESSQKVGVEGTHHSIQEIVKERLTANSVQENQAFPLRPGLRQGRNLSASVNRTLGVLETKLFP